jgi:hypothetical protein
MQTLSGAENADVPSPQANPYLPPADYGRPLDLILVGIALALGTMAGIGAIAYKTWYLHQISENTAIFIVGFLFFIYTGGVWIFSYGWEKGDAAKAIRLTVVIVVLSAVAVLAAALVLAFLSKARASSGGSDSTGAQTNDRSVFGLPVGPILRTAGTYVDDGRLEMEDLEEKPESELLTLTCGQCGQSYIPIPPRAICPNCGWAAVSAA